MSKQSPSMNVSDSPTSEAARISRPRGERTAHILTWMYAVATLANLILLLFGAIREGMPWVEFGLTLLNLPVVGQSLIALVISGVTFWALLRRKRVGLHVAAFFQSLSVLIAVVTFITITPGELQQSFVEYMPYYSPLFDLGAGVFGLVMLWLLWRARAAFPAKIHIGSYGLALLVLAGTLAIAGLVAWLVSRDGSWTEVWILLGRALGLSTPGIDAGGFGIRRWQTQLIAAIYGVGAILSLLVFVRSGKPTNAWTGEKALHLRELLHEYGQQDSLSYFATRQDKSVVFSPDGKAAVAYRVIGSVSLASGDPLGAHSSWAAAIDEWKAEARTYGWIPAVVSASNPGARAYVKAGLAVTPMGDEAILRPDRFSVNNTSMTELRHTVNRLSRAGMTLTIRRHGELTPEQLDETLELVEQWRHGGTERGFSMALNRWGDPSDGRCLLVTAHTADGAPAGLLSFVPWGPTGYSLDVMRRAPDSPNGTTEFMIAEFMAQAEGLGISRVSLNFAMFRQNFARAQDLGASLWTRASSSVLGVLDRFLQLERLYLFNQKFDPSWVPRYFCFDSHVSIINAAAAAGIAEGFLPAWLTSTPDAGGRFTPEQLRSLQEIERRRLDARDLTPRWSDQTRHRIEHLEQMRAAGYQPYPPGSGEGLSVEELHALLADPQAHGQQAAVTGRVRSIRRHGGVVFLDLYRHGTCIQAVLDAGSSGPDLKRCTRWLDTGDYVLLRGTVGASRTGTPSLLVTSWEVTSKALHPIPFDSFTDPEARLRRRSMDLIIHPEESQRLRIRAATIRSIRRTLDEQGFLEVETPMLNTVHGGASARPFKTFINAYGVDLTLRIAPELYLKRLVVGDMGPVYELGRDFRNEGADATHNPEFTVLEAYQPSADYSTMRELTERLLKNAARSVFGEELLPLRFGEHPKDPRTPTQLTDVSGLWPVISVCQAVSEAVGQDISMETDLETLLHLAREHEIHVRDDMGPGAVIEELYGELVEAKTTWPTFYKDFPVETSPLAGPHRSIPGLAERWDLVINGTEMGTAYSEMADALEQRRRLTEQSLKAAAGDLEAMQVDEDFLDALETGLPPTGGLGIGIDRLIMMLTESPIRGVLAFPFVRPGANPRLRPHPRTPAGPDSASTE